MSSDKPTIKPVKQPAPAEAMPQHKALAMGKKIPNDRQEPPSTKW